MSIRFFFLCCGVSLLGALHTSQAQASRNADIIRRLHEQDRMEEGQKYCKTWLGVEEPPNDLREECASVFFQIVDKESAEAWSTFREEWSGTRAAEKARDPYVDLMLADLNGEGSKEKYEELEELALDPEIKQRCSSAGVASALKKVSSSEEAKTLAMELSGKEELYILFERFPEVFFDVQTEGATIQLQKNLDSSIEKPKASWARKCEGTDSVDWNTVVKESLKAEGIPNEQIMSAIQKSTNKESPFPLCPIFNQDSSCSIGIKLESKGYKAFVPQSWRTDCDAEPVLMTFTKRRLRALSLKEGHLVELVNPLYGEERISGNIQAFTKLKKKPYLFEHSLYSKHNNAFVIFPLDGNPPFIGEKPPGTWKLLMGKKVKGIEIPQTWTVDNKDGIEVDLGGEAERSLPSGELVSLSPHATMFLGLDTITLVSLEKPLVEWNRQKPPKGSSEIEVNPLSSSSLNNASTQIFAAGFRSSDVEIYDGWSVDLDRDDEDERIIRLSLNDKEALAVLDYDKDIGPKTYIFETNHAIHGTTRAPVPRAFEQNDETILYWTGKEGQLRYMEWVFSYGTGFEMGHKEF